MDCIFCKIVAGDVPSHKVYEDDATFALLDINPATHGHTLVIPKQHVADLYDASPDVLSAIAHTVQTVARRLQQALQPDALNVIQNNGSAAGQTVFHYHVHLIPRWKGDGALKLWRPGETDHAALGTLAANLRNVGE
jgi:histidine triad (HIT) family protein